MTAGRALRESRVRSLSPIVRPGGVRAALSPGASRFNSAVSCWRRRAPAPRCAGSARS